MQGAGDEFLAGAGFAGDEDGGFGGGDLFNEREDLAHVGAGAGHLAHGAGLAELALEALGLFGEAGLGDGAFEQDAEDGGLDGFFEEPEGAEFVHGADGGFDIAEGGEDDGGDLDVFDGEAAEEFEAVHAGHFEIGDEDGEGLGHELFEGFLAVGGGIGGEAPAAEHAGEAVALGLLVVGDEDAGAGESCGYCHRLQFATAGADTIAVCVAMTK